MNLNKFLTTLVLGTTLWCASAAIVAAGDSCQCGLCAEKCNTCCLKCECADDKKTCFTVECKTVCIPKVVFPWQKKCNPCANNGACVRVVNVLKTKDIKSKKMTYKWTPAMIGGCGCCDATSCCDSQACCDSGASCFAIADQTSDTSAPVATGVRQVSDQQPVDLNDTAGLVKLQRELSRTGSAAKVSSLTPVSVVDLSK